MVKQFKEQVQLLDGHNIPKLGLGVWQATNDQATFSVREALLHGYRLIDTASIYGNEKGVGLGVKESGIDRDNIFVTTKVWNDAHGERPTIDALEQSLERLKFDYIDLYLIHWPAPKNDRYIETWQTLSALKNKGLIRSIGVANFHQTHLSKLMNETQVVPVINQIETHPYLQQKLLRSTNKEQGIQTQSWSPLAQNKVLNDELIKELSIKYDKTPAQVVIRWHLQNELILIPKSINLARIKENLDVFDFELELEDMNKISQLDRGERVGPDPEVFE